MAHLQVNEDYKRRSSLFIIAHTLALTGTAANEKISQVKKKFHECALSWMSLARASSYIEDKILG